MERIIMGLNGVVEKRPHRLDVLAGFTLPKDQRQRDAVIRKVSSFIDAGLDQTITIGDFDQTFTQGHLPNGHPVSVFESLIDKLPPEVADELKANTQKNLYLEQNGLLSVEDARIWSENPLRRFAEHGISKADFRDFAAAAKARECLRSVLSIYDAKKSPFIISSGGISDVIDVWNEVNGIKVTEIVSTDLTFDDSDKIAGWRRLVHVKNKLEETQAAVEKYSGERPNAIIIGDGIGDAKILPMGAPGVEDKDILPMDDPNVLRIRIKAYQGPETEEEKQKYLTKTFEKFDLLLGEGDLMPFLILLMALAGDRDAHAREVRRYYSGLDEVFPGCV